MTKKTHGKTASGVPITDELVAERFAAASDPVALAALAAFGKSFYDPETFEDGMLWREAHRLRHEVLLVWGREDRFIPLARSAALLRALPHARLAVLEACGHLPMLECPRQFNRLLDEFLRSNAGDARRASGGP